MTLLDDSNIPEEWIIPSPGEMFVYQTKHIPTLLRYSFIEVRKVDISGKTYGLHNLVQTATSAWLMHEGELEYWKAEALHRVQSAFPDAEGQHCDWKLCATLNQCQLSRQ